MFEFNFCLLVGGLFLLLGVGEELDELVFYGGDMRYEIRKKDVNVDEIK